MLFVPLYVANPLFFPFITGKNFAFRIIIELVFTAWLMLLLFDREYRPKRSWIFVSLSALVIIASLASIFGANPYRSFWSNYERMDGLVTLLHLVAYFLVLISVFKTESLWKWFWNTNFVVATLVALYGVAQIAGMVAINQSGVRLDATFGNATYLAAYMLLNLFMAMFFIVRSSDVWQRVIYGILAALYFLVMYHTATRGALLGLVLGVLLTTVLIAWKSSGHVKRYATIAGVAVLVLGIAFFMLRKTDFVKSSPVMNRLSSLFSADNFDSKSQPRFIIWKMSLQGALERPILGWGFENYNIVFNKYFDARLWTQETWFDRSHNTPLDWLVMTGVFGLLAYLALFVSSLWLMWRNSNLSLPEKGVLTGLLAGYFIQNLFVFDNLGTYLIFIALLAYMHFRSGESKYLSERLQFKTPNWLREFFSVNRTVVSSCLLVVLAFTLYFANVKPIMANRLLITTLYPRDISPAGLDRLNKLFALNSFGSMETREQLLLMLTELKNSNRPNLDRELFLKYLDLALSQMAIQLKSSGNDARHQLFTGSFLHTFGRTDEALLQLEAALKLSPHKQLIGISLARAYIDAGRIEDAYNLDKYMLELDTRHDRVRNDFAATAIMIGKQEEAEKVLIDRYGTDLIPDSFIIQAYAKVGNLAKVVEIWEEQIKRNPNDPQAYMSLAATYYAQGRDSLAIDSIQRLIAIVPTQKAMGEEFIGKIQRGELPRK